MYLTAVEEKDRLELVRHKVRQIADLTSRLEALEQEKKELEEILTLRDSHIQELKEHVQLLMEKNHAKQEVIMALTEQMARELSDPLQEANTIAAETLYKQQEEIEHLKVCEMAQVVWGLSFLCPLVRWEGVPCGKHRMYFCWLLHLSPNQRQAGRGSPGTNRVLKSSWVSFSSAPVLFDLVSLLGACLFLCPSFVSQLQSHLVPSVALFFCVSLLQTVAQYILVL